jgi:hypothetical protein
MSAAAAFFFFQSRIKIQYLKTAITSLFFRIQKNFMYENYSSNNDLSKCLLDAMVFCNLTPVFSGKIQVKGEKCNILFYNCLNTEIYQIDISCFSLLHLMHECWSINICISCNNLTGITGKPG